MPYSQAPTEAERDVTPDSSLSSSSVSSLNLNNPQRQLSNSSNSSLGADNPNNDEEYYHPNQPYLLPIVIPQQIEPTLDELLRNVTGREDLQNVESLKIRVISLTVSLYRLSSYMPNLSSLNLDGSVLSSLRDLGCGLTNLKFLNVSNCGLTSLDGTNGISAVQTLIADNNMIQLIGPVQNLMYLKKISLKNNRLRELTLVTFLGICELLQEVDLTGNPVCNNPLYRQTMQQSLERLRLLDGKDFSDEPQLQNANRVSRNSTKRLSDSSFGSGDGSMQSEESVASTLSDEPFSSPDLSDHRPATSQGIRRRVAFHNDERERPGTALPASGAQTRRRFLTSGDVVCGSIVGSIREHRKMKSAWADSQSSMSSESSGSISMNSNDLTKPKTNLVPQILTNIELDTGKIDDDDSKYDSSSSNCSLQNIATKWRNECQRK